MGHGRYSTVSYLATTAKSIEDGTAMDYSRTMMRSQPRSSWKMHELLDPKRQNKEGDNAGTIIRESLDFDEHPNTTPIVVVLDVTGSMASVPLQILKTLPDLMDKLHEAKVPDPQVLICAVGDEFSDAVPFQIGQFESDNRIDEQINAIVPEGGGGGGNHESYATMAFFLANYTHLDSHALRDTKGLCFFIGDERLYKNVSAKAIQKHFDDKFIGQEFETTDIFKDLQEKFDTFLFYSDHHRDGGEGVIRNGDRTYDADRAITWDKVLDQEQILILDEPDKVCSRIAQVVASRAGELSEA